MHQTATRPMLTPGSSDTDARRVPSERAGEEPTTAGEGVSLPFRSDLEVSPLLTADPVCARHVLSFDAISQPEWRADAGAAPPHPPDPTPRRIAARTPGQ